MRLFTTHHRAVGNATIFASMAFVLVGGTLAMLMRWQLGWPGVLKADTYLSTLTAHGTIMIFFGLIPIVTHGLGTSLIPSKIGSPEMAFPFLSGLSFWGLFPAAAVFACAFHVPAPAQSGWTSYAPLASIRLNDHAWTLWMWGVNLAAWWLVFAYIAQDIAKCRLQNAIGNLRHRLSFCILAIAPAFLVTWLLSHVVVSGQSAWYASISLLTIPSLAGAINIIATIALCRDPKLRWFAMPLSVWNWLVTAVMVLLATPALLAALVMAMTDHHTVAVGESVYRLSSFFVPAMWAPSNQPQISAGGSSLLWQHLFWFYAHPAVYIMILPVMGMISEIIPYYARRPIYGYRAMVGSTIAIAVLGFLVWAHHMFQSGLNPMAGTVFSLATMLIAVPSGTKVFNWIATLHKGSIRLEPAMCYACAFVALFVVGGMSGVYIASTALNIQLHDTYFIVAHLHYVLFGGSLFGLFAGITHFFPVLFERSMNRTLGYVHFVLTFIFFNCTFFTMHILGLAGAPRRVADPNSYTLYAEFADLNRFISVSAFLLGLSQIPFIVNMIWSAKWGRRLPPGDDLPLRVDRKPAENE